jgi:hypothetical protein
MGIFAEVYFLWRLASAASTAGLAIAELAVLLGLGGALLYRLRRLARAFAPPSTPPPDRSLATLRRFLSVAVLLAIVPAAYLFASALQNQPHGGWDAWMSWNLRARFFFRGGEHWRDTFSNLFWGANPEYPALLPSIVARFWQYCASDTTLAPALVAFLFTLGRSRSRRRRRLSFEARHRGGSPLCFSSGRRSSSSTARSRWRIFP